MGYMVSTFAHRLHTAIIILGVSGFDDAYTLGRDSISNLPPVHLNVCVGEWGESWYLENLPYFFMSILISWKVGLHCFYLISSKMSSGGCSGLYGS